MAAVLLIGHGGLDKLVYRTEFPCRAGPGRGADPGERLRMNNTDVWVRQGAYGTEDDPSAVSTWRGGDTRSSFRASRGRHGRTIVVVGDGVSPARIGERVMVDFSIYNRDDDSLADIDYMAMAETAATPSI